MSNSALGRNRRRITAAAVFGLLASAVCQATAQSAAFPTKPVTVVAPYAAGSGPDAVVRKTAEILARKWKQPVLIDNRPGGGGFVAIEATRRAAPDGHTLLLLDSEHVSALPILYKKRGFKTLDTFDPVGVLYRTTFLVAVATDSRIRSMADLVKVAKATDRQMMYGSWGVGSAGHLGGVLLEEVAGVKMQHVAYRDAGQLYISVANGDVDWALGTLPSSRAAYQAGKLRYLAVAAPKRLPQLPDVPTVAEAGGSAKFDVNSIAVMVAPKGISEQTVAKINADLAQAMNSPEVMASLDSFGFEPLHWNKAEILRKMNDKASVYRMLAERNSISLD